MRLIGYKDPAILVDLETVRIAIIFCEYVPFSVLRYLENPTMTDVDAEKVPGPIEGWTLQEGMQRTRSAGPAPIRLPVADPQAIGQAGEHAGCGHRRPGEHFRILPRVT